MQLMSQIPTLRDFDPSLNPEIKELGESYEAIIDGKRVSITRGIQKTGILNKIKAVAYFIFSFLGLFPEYNCRLQARLLLKGMAPVYVIPRPVVFEAAVQDAPLTFSWMDVALMVWNVSELVNRRLEPDTYWNSLRETPFVTSIQYGLSYGVRVSYAGACSLNRLKSCVRGFRNAPVQNLIRGTIHTINAIASVYLCSQFFRFLGDNPSIGQPKF